MNYIVSGATGCIGYSLVKKLIDHGSSITVILNPNSDRNIIFEKFKNIRRIYASLADYGEVNLNGSFDAFVHMAWSGGSRREDTTENQFSSFQSLKAMELAVKNSCKKFISVGSQAEYGSTNEILNENLICSPTNEFGISKLNTYFRLKSLAGRLPIEFTWLRVLSAYGPYDRSSSMLMQTIHKLLRHEEVKLSDCMHYWDFLHADDIADAIIGLSTTKENSDLYVIGSDEKKILKDYIKCLTSMLGVDAEGIIGKLQTIDNPIVNLRCDSKFLREHISWRPTIDFETGIRQIIEAEKIRLDL